MATPIYDKPNFTNGLWAYAGNKIVPSDEKVATGHVVERPPYEISNYLENRQDQGIAYLFQRGISDWDNLTTYPKDALVGRNGVIYQAISQNDNSDPASNSVIWKRAFYSYSEGDALNTIINRIRTEEGFLNLYVSKSNPIVDGRVKGHGYTADAGVALTGQENVGYSFNNALLDGLYHDGAVPVILNDGSVVARFQTPQSLTENSKNVVTMDILRQVIGNQQGYGVGDIYITTTAGDPAVRLGYGTWEKYAQGLALVGHSDLGTSPNWTRTVGTPFGNYETTLGIPNLPPHNHSTFPYNKFAGRAGDFGSGGMTAIQYDYTPSEMKIANMTPDDWLNATEKTVGSAIPFTNVQPSIVVYMWRRTA